jgi:hypothetical protein
MKAALAGQQFPGPEDLFTGIHEFLSEIQRSELELVFHDWIKPVQWMLDKDGNNFHEQAFYDHYSFQFCPDRPVATTCRRSLNSQDRIERCLRLHGLISQKTHHLSARGHVPDENWNDNAAVLPKLVTNRNQETES